MTFFIFIIMLKALFLGAIYGRIDGGGIMKCPEIIERLLVMSFYVLSCAPFAGAWSLAALGGMIGISTGHGQYFPSVLIKAITSETTDFITRLFYDEDPRTRERYAAYRKYNHDELKQLHPQIHDKLKDEIRTYGVDRLYRRCMFGMFVTGTLTGLPAFVLCVVFGQYYAAVPFLFHGVVKFLSYHYCHKIFEKTEPAEYTNGGLRTLLCLISFYLIY